MSSGGGILSLSTKLDNIFNLTDDLLTNVLYNQTPSFIMINIKIII